MKIRNVLSIIFLAGLFLSLQACKDDKKDDPKPQPVGKEVTIDATSYKKWIYFSFEKGETVGETGVEEEMSGLDWDIAFHRYDVRLNGGTAGTGKGASIATEKIGSVGFKQLKEAPTLGYSKNVDNVKVLTAMPPQYTTTAADTIITGGAKGTWCVFGHGTSGPSYKITDKIFVVKTAKGNYAKIWLKKFIKEKKSGHVTMKYVYQPDVGTNKFE